MLGKSFSVDRDLVQPEVGARSKMDGQSVTQQRQRSSDGGSSSGSSHRNNSWASH